MSLALLGQLAKRMPVTQAWKDLLSKIVSKWIGESEKNRAALFDAAEAGHAVLLFDEADSMFGKRTGVKSSNDRYANVETNFGDCRRAPPKSRTPGMRLGGPDRCVNRGSNKAMSH